MREFARLMCIVVGRMRRRSRAAEAWCRVSGAIEAWTWGTSWESVKAICELEDGDLARLFVRVADLLRQISMCEHVDATLRSTADAARRAIYRQPIKDVLA